MRLVRPSVRSLSVALVFVAFAFTIASAPDADAKGRPNRALVLTPQNVVPGPGDPTAAATFTWNTGSEGFCYVVNVQSLGSFIQRIVIRRGADTRN